MWLPRKAFAGRGGSPGQLLDDGAFKAKLAVIARQQPKTGPAAVGKVRDAKK